MKIVFITPTFYNPRNVVGGMEKYIYQLVKRFGKRHEVTLLVPSEYNFTMKTVKIINYFNFRRPFQLISNIFSSSLSFLYILFKQRPQIVSVFLGNVQTFFILILAKIFHVKTVINLRGAYYEPKNLDYLYGLSFFFADNFMINSKDLLEKYAVSFPFIRQKVFSTPAYFIPNGVDTKLWHPIEEKFEKLYDLCIMANIQDLQRIDEKGFPFLYESLIIIHNKYGKKLKLLVIGKYSIEIIKKRIKNFDSSYIEFAGLISQKKLIISKLRQARIFVLSSLSEGMSNSLLEALSLGIPCIATSVGGAPDVIQNFKNGILVPPANAQELAEKIWLLMNDVKLQKTISENAGEMMVQKYDWNKNIILVEKYYQKILGSK